MSSDINAAGLPAAPGGQSPAGSFLRASVFYDGFNLYHALDELNAPHLKWLNLRALAEKFIRQNESLCDVVWCSARNNKNTDKMLRHRAYCEALKSVNVDCVLGHFIEEPRVCRATCGQSYRVPTEKQGDVNVAIRLISDAHLDRYDVAYLVSADSDQTATAKLFLERFPTKTLVVVAPPGRTHSKAILEIVEHQRTITRAAIEGSIFTGSSLTSRGRFIVKRPEQYAPPQRGQQRET